MPKKYFTEHEIQNMVEENEVASQLIDNSGRWSNTIESIVQDPETSLFYRAFWEQGSTKAQENVFYADELEQLFYVDNHISIEIASAYLSEKQIESINTELVENYEALPVIVEDKNSITNAEKALIDFDIDNLISQLETFDLLNVTQTMSDEKRVVLDYLSKLSSLKSKIID